MRLKVFLLLFFVPIFLLNDSDAGDYEVTPILGYAVGGQFDSLDGQTTYDVTESANYGIIFGSRDKSKPEAFYELLYSRQETSIGGDGVAFPGESGSGFDLDINYLHLGGRYGKAGGRINPFVAAGIGFTHFAPDHRDSETRFSFSLGVGGLVPLGEHLSLRFEGRGFGTLFNSRSHLFCDNSTCSMRVEGDLFWQFNAFAGMVFSF